jgi:hypothetical protein
MNQQDDLCDYCQRRFTRWRRDQRFCSPQCHTNWHNEDRRLALKAWRERKEDEQGAQA